MASAWIFNSDPSTMILRPRGSWNLSFTSLLLLTTKGANHEPRITIYDCLAGVARYRGLPEQGQDCRNARWRAQDKPGASGQGRQDNPLATGQGGGLGGLLGQLGLGGASAGGILSGGLGELIERFKQSGQGQIADSWVNTGANKPCTPADLERAIGPEVLDTLSQQTGLSRDELVTRLCRELPNAVDKYTPQGRLPTEGDFSRA